MAKKYFINFSLSLFSVILTLLTIECLLHIDSLYNIAKRVHGQYYSKNISASFKNTSINTEVLNRFRQKFNHLEIFDSSVFKPNQEYKKEHKGSICCQSLDGIQYGLPNQKAYEKYSNITLSKTIYEAIYTTDRAGRRIVLNELEYNHPSNAIFIGGSFTFGQGVNDNETLSYYYSQLLDTPSNIYNVSYFGFGLNDILYHQEAKNKKNLFQGIDRKKKTKVFYTFIYDHISRALLSLDTFIALKRRHYDEDAKSWFLTLLSKPWYEPSHSKKSSFKGELKDRYFLNFFYTLLENSKIVEVTNLSKILFRYYDVPKYSKIINLSYAKFKEDYNLEDFYIILGGDSFEFYEQLVKSLDPNIKIIYNGNNEGEIVNILKHNDIFPNDGHPTKYYYEILASIVFAQMNSYK